ncbi:hypothetical protein [Herbidospora sp. NBRC 101105]|nr:hypothetical protein [Herbidospora sp. NBRC 101105]
MRRVLAYAGITLLVLLGSLASAAGVVFATGGGAYMVNGSPPCP